MKQFLRTWTCTRRDHRWIDVKLRETAPNLRGIRDTPLFYGAHNHLRRPIASFPLDMPDLGHDR